MAALLDAPARADYQQCLEQVEIEMDNLRSALGWGLENWHKEHALTLASSLQPLWLTRGRIVEGGHGLARSPATAHKTWTWRPRCTPVPSPTRPCWIAVHGQQHGPCARAVTIARQVDDSALLARALNACGHIAGYRYDAESARAYFTEATTSPAH